MQSSNIERPLYEKDLNLLDEIRFFSDLQGHTRYEHYSFKKLPLAYRVECAAISSLTGKVEGFCELKCRSVLMSDYPTLILSLHKWDDLIRYSRYGWSSLFVRWQDYDAVLDVKSTSNYRITFGGREDRGDWQDVEPVVHIPVKDFYLLEIERELEIPSFQGDLNSWEL